MRTDKGLSYACNSCSQKEENKVHHDYGTSKDPSIGTFWSMGLRCCTEYTD